ncbi:MAG TPA: NAD(P)/FAD-dependent oxidoreductase [Candidatus Limnocylindria bacterium]|nr:NAD(P)/FAD-dependent oxidoreductase [Candidatus Limnocylindria bacterium]
MSAAPRHRVVIVGGGFGGLYAARALRRAPIELTLIDRRNFHLFQPLLYQVATGVLSPGDIAAPLRSILRRQRNATVLLGDVREINVDERWVRTGEGVRRDYDTLIVATGARHSYFGHDEWADNAPGLKTIEDATEIRRRILIAYEAAEQEADPERLRAWMNFVVVGAGPTGVELAGALGEIAHETLRGDFRRIRPQRAQIHLVEGLERVLPGYPAELSHKAQQMLARLGVDVRTGTLVTGIDEEGVTLGSDESQARIAARTVLWAAGVQASSFGRLVAEATGAQADKAGRLRVKSDLSLPGHPEIFVIGDLALYTHQGGEPLPGVAQVAIQQGGYVAKAVEQRLAGRRMRRRFRYFDPGNLATIGRGKAVGDFGLFRLAGFPAWVVWAGVHVLYLVEFENRVLVVMQWAWNYITRRRGARLITGRPLQPEIKEPG